MLFLKRGRRVTMTASVGDLEAGKQYKLPAAVADSYIVKGYADGKLSREFSPDERNTLRSTMQTVNF